MSNKRKLFLYGIPFLAAVMCYFNSLDGDLVHDDIPAIKNNMDLRSTTPVITLFSNDFWGKPIHDVTSHKSYRPLTVLTFRFNFLLHGVQPLGYHVVNVINYGIVCVLFTKLCYEEVFFKQHGTSLLAGLLFTIHPIHTETVSNVVGRAEIMSAMFFILSFISYKRNRLGKVAYQLFCCIVLALAGMLCKEQSITVLGVCLVDSLYSHLMFSRKSRQCYCPFSDSFFILFSVITLLSLRVFVIQGSVPNFKVEDNPSSFHNSTLTRLYTRSYIYAWNVWLLLWPRLLSHDWQFASVPLVHEILDSRNLYSLLLFLSISIRSATAFYHEGDHAGRVGIMLLIIPFLPASNIFFRVGFVIAERTLFLPSMGYVILLADVVKRLSTNYSKKKVAPFLVLLVIFYTSKTIVRNLDWKSRESLANAGIRIFPHNAKMQFNYANMIRDLGLIDEAEYHYKEAVRLWPDYASAHNNLGTLLMSTNVTAAKHRFEEAIKACPNHANSHFNLGSQLWIEGDNSKALFHLTTALSLDKACSQCHVILTLIYCDTNDLLKAQSHFQIVLEMNGSLSNVVSKYFSCLQKLIYNGYESLETFKNLNRSQTLESKELRFSNFCAKHDFVEERCNTRKFGPDDDAHLKRIMLHQQEENISPNLIVQMALHHVEIQQYHKAAKLLKIALHFIKDFATRADVLFVLGECHKNSGNIESAISAFQETLIFSRENGKAHHNLAVAYHLKKDVVNARYHYNKALDLQPKDDLLQQNYEKFLLLK